MAELPSIGIVIPCIKSAAVLPRAMDSLLDQGCENLRVVVIDGGSSDGTVDVLRRYQDRLAWWVSEPDMGQADAINKGFAHCDADVVTWLCADDVLMPGALHTVQTYFQSHPETEWLVGACRMKYPVCPGRDFTFVPPRDVIDLMPAFNGIMQPSSFWRRRIMQREPPLDVSYHYALDAELWCHFKACGHRPVLISDVLSQFIQSGDNKTATGGGAIGAELDRLYRAYTTDRIPLSMWYNRLRYPFERHLRRDRGMARLLLLRGIQICYMVMLGPFYGWRRVWKMSWPA